MDSMQLQPLDDRNRAIAVAVRRVVEPIAAKPSQVALAWVMARGITPIVGATPVEQMQENMVAATITLPAEVLAELDAASALARRCSASLRRGTEEIVDARARPRTGNVAERPTKLLSHFSVHPLADHDCKEQWTSVGRRHSICDPSRE